MVFYNLPFYFHSALNYLCVHLDIWARIRVFFFTSVDIMPGNK